MLITFRMDDICPQMNITKFMEYRHLFDQFGVKPLIGVVPDNQDDTLKIQSDILDFWDMLRQLQIDGWCIAQHGYQHVYCSNKVGILTKRRLSEFAGLPYEEQLEKIIKGKTILEQNGLKTDIFMAPGHSFDVVTLKVLKQCGFNYVTDGHSSFPYMCMDLKFIPCRNMTPLILPGINTICIHSNTSTNKTFRRVKKLLENKNGVCDFKQVLNVRCFNTTLCEKEEKLYQLSNKYFIIPAIQVKQRIFKSD